MTRVLVLVRVLVFVCVCKRETERDKQQKAVCCSILNSLSFSRQVSISLISYLYPVSLLTE